MKILLISANREIKPAPVFPLGVARLAAHLKSRGHGVRVFDCLVDGCASLSAMVQEYQPGLIGVSLRNVDNTESGSTLSYVDGYIDVMARLRASTKAPVVLGGTAFSIFPEEMLLALQADYGIAGSGEEVLADLAQALETGVEPDTVPGLMIRRGPHALRTARRAALPRVAAQADRDPAWVKFYWEQGGSLNVQTQLGCRHACVYCTYPQLDGPGCRTLAAVEVAEEMAQLAANSGVTHFFVVDSVFNLHPEHAEAFCRELIRLGRPVTWTCFCEPGREPEGFLKLMAEAGCTHIEFGTDSLCDPVLEAYGKPFRTEDILRWSRASAEAGIHQAHFLILGGPGETRETLPQSFKFSRELKPAAFFPYFGMRIFPRTPLYRRAVSEGLITAGEPLLKPRFYFSNETPPEWLAAQVEVQARTDPRWITPETWKQSEAIMQRLRARGKKGPLWEYLAR